MDPVRIYDGLTQARQKLFDWVRPLSQAQYTQEFPFGLKTLRGTLMEMAAAEWIYARRIRGEAVPPRETWPFTQDRLPTFAALEAAWRAQQPEMRATLADVSDWAAVREWKPVVQPEGKTLVMSARVDDVAAQFLMHEVHHRAQAMAMLRQLGVPAQNLDYSSLVFRRTEEPA